MAKTSTPHHGLYEPRLRCNWCGRYRLAKYLYKVTQHDYIEIPSSLFFCVDANLCHTIAMQKDIVLKEIFNLKKIQIKKRLSILKRNHAVEKQKRS